MKRKEKEVKEEGNWVVFNDEEEEDETDDDERYTS